LSDSFGHGFLAACIAGIGGDHHHVAAETFSRRIEIGLTPAGDRNRRPFLQKLAGRFQSDAAGCAGDKSGFSPKPVRLLYL